MIAVNYQRADKEWHHDTRATHHLTNDMDNIHLYNINYDYQDHIQVNKGAVLKIVHNNTSTVYSPSKSFILNEVLLVS